jgi:hypothetical protein
VVAATNPATANGASSAPILFIFIMGSPTLGCERRRAMERCEVALVKQHFLDETTFFGRDALLCNVFFGKTPPLVRVLLASLPMG